MTSSTGIAASQLRQLIFYHLDNDFTDTANFLAGRLHTLEPRNPDASHLLALTYFRLRRLKAAYDFSHKFGANGRHLGCAYVFAQACLDLGRNTEGISALERAKSAWVGKSHWNQHSETSRRHIPDAPAVWTLLGKLWKAHGDLRQAGDCFIEAHQANAFMWDAFEGLCKIGADLKVENMFRPMANVAGSTHPDPTPTQIYVDEEPRQPLAPQPNFGISNILTPIQDPFSDGRDVFLPKPKGKSALTNGFKSSVSEWDTPPANGIVVDQDTAMGGLSMENEDGFQEPPAAPSRRPRAGQLFEAPDKIRAPALRDTTQSTREHPHEEHLQAPRKPSVGGQKRTISGALTQPQADPSSQPRRSNRLFTQTTTTRTTRPAVDSGASIAGRGEKSARTAKVATGAKRRTAQVGRVVSGNRKVLPPDPTEKEKETDRRAPSRNSEKSSLAPSLPGATGAQSQKQITALGRADVQAEQQAMTGLLDNFRQLAIGCHAISRFELPEAIQVFRSLPTAQRESPWVLAQLGKAHYEAADYRSAEECFSHVMKFQPSRVEDMEIYSTVLWHLKKESTLACLCHMLRDQAFDAPQTWVAVGNAFSLTRDHDQAITAFKRATQLDDTFAYAWTLMGHEFIANEAFDSALSAFRKSVAVERRGYGGWYGLGKSYERMGKLEEAERHYRIAATINPSNSTLLVCIGVVLERLRNKKAALANYTKALDLAPQSALARFKKARVLMHLRYFNEALVELEVLRDQEPDEANVWFLLGKCYKGIGERGEALRALTTALNLDVKV